MQKTALSCMATSVNHMVDHWQRECWQLAGGFACVHSERKTKETSEKKLL